MKSVTVAAFLLVATISGTTVSRAQQGLVPLDSVLVEVNSRAAPALGSDTRAVEVISAAEIRNLPVSTIADVLRWAFGVDLMSRSPALADVAIRGSSFEQVLILVDGVRVRDSQTGHFNLNLTVPLDQIARVEILRGPAASLYGSDAMAGVINIVTRGSGSSVSARFTRGSFETTEAAVAGRATLRSSGVDFSAVYQESEGHRPGTDFEIAQTRVALSTPLGGHVLDAAVGFAARDFGADGFYGNFPSFESIRTATASARWRMLLAPGTSIEPLVSFRRNSDDFILFRDEPERYRNRHTTDQVVGELIARTAVADRFSLAVGLHTTHEEIRSSALGDHAEWTAAGSMEMAAGQPHGAAVTAGMRVDRLATGSAGVSPSLSVAFRPVSFVRARASAGHSFRAPTWTERYYRDPANIGNPNLDPETAWTIDAGFDATLPFGWTFGATAFRRRAEDLIDWARDDADASAPWVTRNVESADFRGIEAELAARGIMSLDFGIEASWLSLTSSAAPGFSSKYALRPQVEKVALSVDRSVGMVHGGLRASRERRSGEEAYSLVDFRTALDIGEVRIRFDLRNVLDEDYFDITYNRAPGRNAMLGLDWRP